MLEWNEVNVPACTSSSMFEMFKYSICRFVVSLCIRTLHNKATNTLQVNLFVHFVNLPLNLKTSTPEKKTIKICYEKANTERKWKISNNIWELFGRKEQRFPIKFYIRNLNTQLKYKYSMKATLRKRGCHHLNSLDWNFYLDWAHSFMTNVQCNKALLLW